MFKKCLLILIGLIFIADAQATGPQDKPVGEFPESLIFKVAADAASSCAVPPPLVLTVVRNHPQKPLSTLRLNPDSPYSSAVVLASDPYNATSIRHYTDEVKHGAITMILKGQSKPRGGTWSDNKGCKGSFSFAS